MKKLAIVNKSGERSLDAELDTASFFNPILTFNVFDRVSLPTFIIDKNHEIIYWNSALEALSGLSRDEMVGTQDQWRPFYSSPRPCLADLILEGGSDADVQTYYTNKYKRCDLINDAYEAEDFFPECGERGEWLHFTAASVLDDQGNIIGAIETFTNISDRKKAEFELLAREKVYRELSITDNLTGLHNSRHFFQKLEEAIESSRRYGQIFSLCFFDLDSFKQLNDTHGHVFGNEVLETFGAIMRSCLRALDIGFRYGGEEFVILLPSTDVEGAVVVAERVRKSIKHFRFMSPSGESVNCTVSVGVTMCLENDSIDNVTARADKALYQAKAAGKDQVKVYEM